MDADVRLVVVLVNLAPAALGAWFHDRWPSQGRRLIVGWYGVVLACVVGATYALIGRGPSFESRLPSPGAMVAVGLALGSAVIAIDLAIGAAIRRLRRSGRDHRRLVPRAETRIVLFDTPAVASILQGEDNASPRRFTMLELVTAAVLEECIYRQTLLWLLSPHIGVSAAAAVAVTFFGLIHFPFGMGSVVSKLAVGACLTAAVIAGSGLLAAIVAHVVLNVAAYVAMSRAGRIVSVLSPLPGRS